MPPCPLQQSKPFAKALPALGTAAEFHALPGHTVPCLIQTRHVPLIGRINLISRGPADGDLSGLADLDIQGPLIVNLPTPVPELRGFCRLAKTHELALLPIASPITMRRRMHQKWRHALGRGERALRDIRNESFDDTRHAWVIEAEAKQQKARGYRNWPPAFLSAYAHENPGQARVISAWKDGMPRAAIVVLCHAPWATYHLGITTPTGRATSAHHLLIWHAATWLSAHGYSMLDMGHLTGPEGLNRFKLRSGAEKQELGGTWIRWPKPVRRVMIYWPSIHSPSGQNA